VYRAGAAERKDGDESYQLSAISYQLSAISLRLVGLSIIRTRRDPFDRGRSTPPPDAGTAKLIADS
jgi:hypothetical protein